jgi:hypothetical protein
MDIMMTKNAIRYLKQINFRFFLIFVKWKQMENKIVCFKLGSIERIERQLKFLRQWMSVWLNPAKQNVTQTGMGTFLCKTCVMNAATQVARPDERTNRQTERQTDGRVCVDDVHVGK